MWGVGRTSAGFGGFAARTTCGRDRVSPVRHPVLRTAIGAAQTVTGRQRLAKFARLLTDEVRLDTANDISSNGEALVQRAALTVDRPVVLDVGAHFGEWS